MSKIISFPKKTKSSVGIELGANSIKMVETRKTDSGFELLTYGIAEIPPEKKGGAERDISAISALVKQLLSLCKQTSPKIYFSISGPSVSYQIMKLPPMPEKEILPAILWKGKKHFPFDLSEARVCYKKISRSDSDKNEIDLIAMAALNQFIDKELEIFQKLGIRPAGIDTASSAIQHLLKYRDGESHDQTVVFLDIEAQKTTLSIFKTGTLQFFREISTGGNDFTHALMESFSIENKNFKFNFTEAEEIKTTFGIPMARDHGTTPQGIPFARIMFIMRPVMEKLITETLRSLGFFKSQTNEKTIDRVILCSGGAKLKNLPELLSSGLGIEVSLFNPFENIRIPFELQRDEYFLNNRHRLSISAGLSVGQARDFNFLPSQPGLAETVRLRKWIPLLTLILCFSTLFALYSRLSFSVSVTKKELIEQKKQLASLGVFLDKLTALTEKRDNLKKKLEMFPDFSLEQPRFSPVFLALTQIFPDSVLLNRIILKKVKGDTKDGSSAPSSISIKIEGIVIGDEYEVFSILTQVTEKLEENKLFYNVIIDSSEKVLNPEQGGLRFVLKCLLEPSSFS